MIEEPDRCLARAGVEENVIRVGIEIQISHAGHFPASRQRGSEDAALQNVPM